MPVATPSPMKERVARLNMMREMIYPVPQSWIQEAKEQRVRESQIQLEECTSYTALVDAWKQAMEWSDNLDMALSVILGVVLTTDMMDDQVWLRLISVASSGKTTLCEAISACREYVLPKDTITRFYSGYKTPDGEDTSIVAQVNGKTLVVKDGDTILRMADRELFLAQARSLFDTSGRTHYNNQTSRDYENVRFTFIIAGTHRLKDLDESDLGERFIDFVLLDEVDDRLEDSIGRRASHRIWKYRAVKATGKAINMKTREMRRAIALTAGYVKYLRENGERLRDGVSGGPDTPEAIRIRRLGKFVSYLRCKPPNDRKRTDTEVKRELSTRLGNQLEKLAICIAAVMGESSLSPEVMRRIRKVAMDTSRGKSLDILQHANKSGVDGTTRNAIELTCDVTGERLNTYLRHMRYNKVLEGFKDGSQTRYRVREKFRKLYREVNR